MIKNFFSWINTRLRHLPPFQVLRQALFESIARSCRIRRNPQAIRTLKVISPISPPSAPRSPAPRFSDQRPSASSRWSFSKALFPKGKRHRATHKTTPRKDFNPKRSSQPCPLTNPALTNPALTDPNNIVYAVPRADIVETLNQTLHQTPGQTPGKPQKHPIPHPESGPISRQETPSRPPHTSPHSSKNRKSSGNTSRQSRERVPHNSLERPTDQPPTHQTIDRLERSYADHPDTLEELSDSAYLCECQGRYAEAERLHKQVLTLKQRRLGPEHLEVAITLNDLSALYCLHNRHEVALPLLHEALTIRQQHLVAHHPDLGETLHQLAKVYRHQEQYGKAEPLFQRALSIFRQQLGGQHPRTQAVYNDLMQMIVTTIEGGKFSELASELPPLDLNTLSDTYSWAKPSWQQ